ncbi:hypothetical protein GIB67_041553 [Kingdonia uniflora]|uniref:Uncharacterized protein n=1 Tax=Kingdonia uniflora TaxID=39325 RepID=A0A7J7MQP5_9MAGN|nr:hypothetical protein GIB67_041553 [Kingdonia uniflora]
MVTTRHQAYEERVQKKMMILQTRYFGNQSLSLPTPIPIPPTFHGMSWEEVEEADDDYHQMWHFHYMVLFVVHRRSYLRMLAEDAVAAEDEKAGVSSIKYCRYPAKDWVLQWWRSSFVSSGGGGYGGRVGLTLSSTSLQFLFLGFEFFCWARHCCFSSVVLSSAT